MMGDWLRAAQLDSLLRVTDVRPRANGYVVVRLPRLNRRHQDAAPTWQRVSAAYGKQGRGPLEERVILKIAHILRLPPQRVFLDMGIFCDGLIAYYERGVFQTGGSVRLGGQVCRSYCSSDR